MSYLKYTSLQGVKAFSTCRDGGYSTGAYASLNCTHYCGDDPDHVAANKKQVCLDWDISPETLFIPHQVHGTKVEVVDDNFITHLSPLQQAERLEGVDALISPLADCALAISTADCVPILIYDTRARIVAAAHAGWRGTVGGIVSRVMECMASHYGTRGSDVRAIIGPSISLRAFEVGDEVYEAFSAAGFPMDRIARREEKWHIDLWEANRLQLLEGGVPAKSIHTAGVCTFTDSDRFFSARKLGIKSGRILSVIMRTEGTK